MTPSQSQLVFERFMQASPITHVTNGGSGLGLWVARNLCELHGGRIQVLSTLGEGTVFRGFVAVAAPSDGEEPVQLPSPAGSALGLDLPVELLPPVGRRLRVLVVDDNQVSILQPVSLSSIWLMTDNLQINRTILRRQLHGVGHEVEEARDGREALEKLSAACMGGLAYDCCLMDVEASRLSFCPRRAELILSFRRADACSRRRIGYTAVEGLRSSATGDRLSTKDRRMYR